MKMNKFKRHMICLLVTALLLTVLSPAALAATTVTLNFVDVHGNAVDLDTISITSDGAAVNVKKTEGKTGVYTFTTSKSWLVTISLSATASGYEPITDQAHTFWLMLGSSSQTVTLTPVTVEEDNWVTFDLYYYIGTSENPFPSKGFSASGNTADYGPSGDDTPFAQINVDITKLKTYTNSVVYEESTSENVWQFTPKVSEDSTVEEKVAATKVFWEAVLECSDNESLQALWDTGLHDHYVGYCLKNQGSSSSGDYHGDGILSAAPPIYVVELHKDNVYVGGTVNGVDEPFPTMMEILDLLEGYLGYVITWNENEDGTPLLTDGAYTGTYIIHEDNKATVYSIKVTQTIGNAEGDVKPEASEISYRRVDQYYHLASFKIETDISHSTVSYTVTYTDGVEDETVFYNHEFGAQSDGSTTPTAPTFPHPPHRTGYRFDGWKLRNDGNIYTDAQIASMPVTSNLVFDAQWSTFRVVFHSNNEKANGGQDIFRVYYPEGVTLPTDEPAYLLNTDGTVPTFYELPEFGYEDHNSYLFKGWYTTEDTAMDCTTAHSADVHFYAHWFETGSVPQEDDGKELSGSGYQGFDLAGLQIRTSENDTQSHNGTAGGGLRFITVLSESLYSQINALPGNENGAEYGFVMAKSSVLASYTQDGNYRLEYKGSDVNGKDTTADYSYVINLECSGYTDHFNGQAYRLYTGVVTYKSAAAQGDAALAAAHASDMVARSYIRYYDANGLYRTYYNNYTGNSKVGGGCSASYDTVLSLLQGE